MVHFHPISRRDKGNQSRPRIYEVWQIFNVWLLTIIPDAYLFVLLSFNPPDFVQEAANQAIHDVAANQYRCV